MPNSGLEGRVFHPERMVFTECEHPCVIRLRFDGGFAVRDINHHRGYRYIESLYLAEVTFEPGLEILEDLFDCQRWLMAVDKRPGRRDVFKEPNAWWISLYCQIIRDTWRDMGRTTASNVFPDDVIDYVKEQCMTHYFFTTGGIPCSDF